MKVTNDAAKTSLRTGGANSTKKSGDSGKPQASRLGGEAALAADKLGSARIDFSERAQDIKKAKEIALASPDVDEAKVARLQALVDSGKYKVNAKDVADRMVNEQLKNAFFESEE